MFGVSKKDEGQKVDPPVGIAELVFCVLDEKFRVHHLFRSGRSEESHVGFFELLNNPAHRYDDGVLREAFLTRKPATMTFSYGEGARKHLYILPYERKWGKWRYACMQIEAELPNPDAVASVNACPMAEERMCLILADSSHTIRSVSSRIPEVFGYSSESLMGMSLSDIFTDSDLGMIESCSPDTNESIISGVFHCLDGSKREVEVKKYMSADNCTLYAICDVTRPQITEEVAQISMRERRRIGQDLHDSIGQLLTGISLLSRSLANALKWDSNSGEADAAQISELADAASNQIRQISRGLMPSEIVERGLFTSLRDLAQITTDSCGVECRAILDEELSVSDGAVETHLFRIAQEAVNNAVRHANASRIDIIVLEADGALQLEICDDGTWKEADDSVNGLGMKTMQYRSSVIGGRLKVGAAPQGGTNVVCRLEIEELLETKV